jgi:hypothetical protein
MVELIPARCLDDLLNTVIDPRKSQMFKEMVELIGIEPTTS